MKSFDQQYLQFFDYFHLFSIYKITNILIAADMMHYKQSIVSKSIFINRLTESEYQYLLFIFIGIYLEGSFDIVVTF